MKNEKQEHEEIVLASGRHDPESYDDYEISLMDLVESIRVNKLLFVLLTAILFCFFIAVCFFLNKNFTVSTTIQNISPGVDVGLNPDNTKFDIYEITKAEIIEKGLKAAAIKSPSLGEITVAQIRKSMEIVPVVPSNIEEIVKSKLAKGEAYSYFPTQYTVKITFGWGFGKEDAKLIVSSIVDEYRNWYVQRYLSGEQLAHITQLDLQQYDYDEVVTILDSTASKAIAYFDSLPQTSLSFRSKESEYSFSDILEDLRIVRTIDINNMITLINTNLLTKDKEQKILRYQNRIELNKLDINKKTSEAAASIELMDKYKGDESKIIIPGLTLPESETIAMGEEGDKFYDDIAGRAIDSKVIASDKTHENAYLLSIIEMLKNDTVASATKKNALQKVSELQEKVIRDIDLSIARANELLTEYYATNYEEAVRLLYLPAAGHKYSWFVLAAASAAASICIAFVLVFIRWSYKRNKDRAVIQNI